MVDDATIKDKEKLRDDILKLTVIDSRNNEGSFRIKRNNDNGRGIINKLFLSQKIIGTPLESFPNLELDYFK